MDVPFPISVVGQETVLSPLPDEAQTPGARWGGWGAGEEWHAWKRECGEPGDFVACGMKCNETK